MKGKYFRRYNDIKKGVGKLILGVILIVLGILAKVNGTSLFTYDVSGVDAAQAAIAQK